MTVPAKSEQQPVFHVEHPQDQPVIDKLNSRLKVWRRASSKAWRTRKRVAAHRDALLAAEREETE